MPVPMMMVSYRRSLTALSPTYHNPRARRRAPLWPLVALVLAHAPGCSTRERAPVERELDVWLGGDVHVSAGPNARLGPLARELKDAVGIINLEGPVGSGESSAERLVNRGDALLALAAAGVAVAGVRNNHDRDLGDAGLARTVAALIAADIAPAGMVGNPGEAGDEADSLGIAVFTRNDITLAVTAHDLSPVSKSRALGELRPDIQRAVSVARARADVAIATFHVRAPPSYLPRPELIEAVEVALSAGALVVAAHGSHALARVERRGRAVIAWGLGNLLFDCECTRERDALLVRLRLTVQERAGDRAAAIARAQVIPIDAGLWGEPARLASDGALTLELLRSLGSELFDAAADRAYF